MFSRREFLQAAAAISGLAGDGLPPLRRVAAQQRLGLADILRIEPVGTATILFLADLHAQLLPVHFREPSVNLASGEARGRLPHLTDAAFRAEFGLAAGSADAFALTSDDFTALARTYGRMGGMDRIATIVEAVRARRGAQNVLLLDGGDTWQGSWSALQTGAQDMVDVMSALGVEAMVGHWEFTLGAARVRQIADTAPFAFLAQNIRSADWQEPVFAPHKIFEKGGVRIGVIGQAMPRTAVTNPRWMFAEWEFGIRERELQTQVDQMRAGGAAVVVLLSHNGFDIDRKLAARVSGIDVILTAHTHDAMPGLLRVGNTALVAAGSHGKFVARLDLDVRDGKLADLRFRLMPVFSDAIEPDAAMTNLVNRVRAPFAAQLAEEIGHARSLLYRRGSLSGTLDDLICRAMTTERDTEIAFSPGFRWGASLLPGDPITFEAITNATAITYGECYRQEMTGRAIKDHLEDVADNIFHPDPYLQSGGDMVRTGGLGYRIHVGNSAGNRISDLTHLKTGEKLEAWKSYSVSGWASLVEGQEGPPIWDIVRNYVADVKEVTIEPSSAVIVADF